MIMAIAYICDIILVLILLVAVVNGTKVGFVQSIIELFLNIITIVVIVAFLNPVRDFLLKYIDLYKIVGDTGNVWKNYLLSAGNYLAITILIFIVISIIVMIVMIIARRSIEDKRIDSPTFAKWDRWLGLGAGLIRGVISCALISLIVSQPIFFPSIQEDVSKTTITKFTYKTTQNILKETTDLNDDELTNVIVAYFMGSDLENIEEAKDDASTYRMTKITALAMDLPELTKSPKAFLENNGTTAINKYIIYISAIADITAMSPQNENLDKQFIKLYDELVSYIPEGTLVAFTAEQFDDMYNVNHGSFYKVRLDDERINKLKNVSCYEVCYVEE